MATQIKITAGDAVINGELNDSPTAKAIVKATTHFQDPKIIAEVSKNLGEAMPGLDIKQIPTEELLSPRGW